MCGIVGYVGQRPARGIVVDALRRMEYRGYDSSGVALIDGNGGLTVHRRAGRLANLEADLAETDDASLVGSTGLGHTRWATHGRPTDRNAHPHRDAAGKIAVVHNGIIENFAALRAELEAIGVEFASDTDTEVAVHLVAWQYQPGEHAGDFVASVVAVLPRLAGHFTLVFARARRTGPIVAARRSTPLVSGSATADVRRIRCRRVHQTLVTPSSSADRAVVVPPTDTIMTSGTDAECTDFHIDWDLTAAERAASSTSCSRRSPSGPGDTCSARRRPIVARRAAPLIRSCARSTRCSSSRAEPYPRGC
jgi:glucosamine--fructose-6-phosphate aminotransferase (isomerizing)